MVQILTSKINLFVDLVVVTFLEILDHTPSSPATKTHKIFPLASCSTRAEDLER